MVYELALSTMANILSFTRMAGFGIAHAALATVVAEMMIANPILGMGMGLIFLNVFSLTLELVVVMIQATRLLFYEVMSKFFEGSGRMLKPYKI